VARFARCELGAQQVGIGLAQQLFRRTAVQRSHAEVDVQVAAGRDVLDGKRGFEPLDQAQQDGAECGIGQTQPGDEFARAVRQFGRLRLHRLGH
jgi:hypothetical protein